MVNLFLNSNISSFRIFDFAIYKLPLYNKRKFYKNLNEINVFEWMDRYNLNKKKNKHKTFIIEVELTK